MNSASPCDPRCPSKVPDNPCSRLCPVALAVSRALAEPRGIAPTVLLVAKLMMPGELGGCAIPFALRIIPEESR